MLSVLIPIYDCNALPLVTELYYQCSKLNLKFEILCQDDASNSPLNLENEKINKLQNCSFISLKENVAHRENRNILASKAKYNYLLFIDGDSKVINPDFIKNYIDKINAFDVVYGGRIHSKKCPSKNQILRWKYGKYIEDKDYTKRSKSIYKSLLFNNTLISKKTFNKIKFDSELTLYGHDDTQFSYELSLIKASISHINNPVLHENIDNNQTYLNKTKSSLNCLNQIFIKKKISKDYVKIINVVLNLKKVKLHLFFKLLYSLFNKRIENYLIESNNPSLYIFNLYRISYLCKII